MARLLRFDDEGDPSVDPDPGAGSGTDDGAPLPSGGVAGWGQGALDPGDGTPGEAAFDPVTVDAPEPVAEEGPWDVFWDRSLQPDPLDDPFDGSGLPAPGDGAGEVDLDLGVDDDPGAGDGEVGAEPL